MSKWTNMESLRKWPLIRLNVETALTLFLVIHNFEVILWIFLLNKSYHSAVAQCCDLHLKAYNPHTAITPDARKCAPRIKKVVNSTFWKILKIMMQRLNVCSMVMIDQCSGIEKKHAEITLVFCCAILGWNPQGNGSRKWCHFEFL